MIDAILIVLMGVLEKIEDNDDLFLKEPIKMCRMTNQELAWWLGECPNEHREWKTKNRFYCI